MFSWIVVFKRIFVKKNMENIEMNKIQPKSSKDEGFVWDSIDSGELCFMFSDRTQNLNFMKKIITDL